MAETGCCLPILLRSVQVIAYTRRELRSFRRSQRRTSWQLARKLRNTQQQVLLLQVTPQWPVGWVGGRLPSATHSFTDGFGPEAAA